MITQQSYKPTTSLSRICEVLDRSYLQRPRIEEVLEVEFQGSWDKIRTTEE